MGGRAAIAFEIGARRIRALSALRAGGRLVIRRAINLPLPASLDRENAAKIGQWIGRQLRDAKIGKCAATIALAREHVVLKRLTLPTTAPQELPEMTRLAIQRELPFATDQAVIDFVPVDENETSTTVLAVAIPRSALDFVRDAARAADLDIERISLRGMGSAALVSGRPGPDDARQLIVDISDETVEFLVLAGGSIRFSRAATIPPESSLQDVADVVATETRRTWLSYRIADDSSNVGSAIVLGRPEVAETAANPIDQLLQVPTEVLTEHPRIDQTKASINGAWALAGLLLEPSMGRPMIDFAQPRKAPDLAARRRQKILAAIGLALIAGGIGWTFGGKNLERLREEVSSLRTQRNEMAHHRSELIRAQDRLTHLQRWEANRPDWESHIAHLLASAPSPRELVLDGLSGRIESAQITWNRSNDKWSSDLSLRIVLDGEAEERAVADAWRARLVDDPLYETSSSGRETAGGRRLKYPFMYLLQTHEPIAGDGPGPPNSIRSNLGNRPPMQGALADKGPKAGGS